MLKLRSLEEMPSLAGKKVFVRVDFDVPLKAESGKWFVLDDRRLVSGLRTVSYLVERAAKVILAGHLDRPGGQADPAKSTQLLADFYASRFRQVLGVDDCLGPLVQEKLANELKSGGVLVLENLRFHKGEEENDPAFARSLADLADFYVSENFSDCHRNHASIVLLPKLLPAFAGFHLLEEVAILSKVLEKPARPLVIVIGGAKVETKMPVVRNFLDKAERIFVGGLPGCHKEFLEALGEKVVFACGDPDLSFNVAKTWALELLEAKTIVWNGPLGDTSNHQTLATELIAQAIVEATKKGATSIVGGGDTEAYLSSVGLDKEFSFISTGGGALLEFLAGRDLPGLSALAIPSLSSA